MTFEETKEFIEKNQSAIEAMAQQSNVYPTLKKMLEAVENEINKDSPSEPEDAFIEEVSYTLETLLKRSVLIEYSPLERDLMYDIAILYNNFNEAFNKCIPNIWELDILFALISAERSLNDTLLVNNYLIKRLQAECFGESTNTLLSNKYFYEYQNFLKGKNHDSDYSIGNSLN